MKADPQMEYLDPFSFDGCPPTGSLDPTVIDNNNTTSFQDLLKGHSSTLHDNVGLLSDCKGSDQFGKPATPGPFGDFNASQLPINMEPLNTEGAWMPTDPISKNPDYTGIDFSAEPNNIDYRMWDTIEDIPLDFSDTVAHPKAESFPVREPKGDM